jgi:glycosyltransferase involved in cell wall biosynthesis
MSGKDPDIAHHIQLSKGNGENLLPVQENFWNLYPKSVLESISFLPFTGAFKLGNRINNKRFAADIKEAIKKLGFTNILLFNDNDIYRGYYLKELLQPDKYIYYSRDNLVAMDFWKKHGAKLEPIHIAKADIAVANSLYLTDRLKQYNKNSYYIGQGCDLRLFDPAQNIPKPAALSGLKGPVIGYVGNLTAMRIDPAILMYISRQKPDWNVVLVGPEDEVFQQSPLHQQPNVHFLGRKDMTELPAFMQHFDVCLNPQLVNPVTIGNYPLKIDEYLAMGKPTVATATKTMELFKDHVYLAGSVEEYVPLIEKALQENNPALAEARIAFARSHTWENSVAGIYKAISETR